MFLSPFVRESVGLTKTENKSRQINRRDARSLDGFRRLGVSFFIHGLSCRSPAVSALLHSPDESTDHQLRRIARFEASRSRVEESLRPSKTFAG